MQPSRKFSLRIAHITDCHVSDNPKAIQSVAGIFKRLEIMPDRPELIVNTGDAILDANFRSYNDVLNQWNIWTQLTASLQVPLYNTIGNHDIWIPSMKTFLREIKNPKRWSVLAKEMLRMPATYYSFEQNGWKFIALFSMGRRYGLGRTQLAWLEKELDSAKGPVCLFSHVPILSIASFMYHLNKKRWWPFPIREMQSDTLQLQALFRSDHKVKLCLSGHVHYVDDVSYGGVRYLCQGAVCGNWWREPTPECSASYAILDLFDDGSVEKQVVYY